jgi:hypothetical protein
MYDDFARRSTDYSYFGFMQAEGKQKGHDPLEFDLMVPTHARAFLLACLLVQDLLGEDDQVCVQTCSDTFAIQKALEVYNKMKFQQESRTLH